MLAPIFDPVAGLLMILDSKVTRVLPVGNLIYNSGDSEQKVYDCHGRTFQHQVVPGLQNNLVFQLITFSY